jgi:hypothetical protein
MTKPKWFWEGFVHDLGVRAGVDQRPEPRRPTRRPRRRRGRTDFRGHDHGDRPGPAVATRPDPTQVGRPAFVRCDRHGGHRLDPGAHADGAFADLPAFDLEDALHGVLVKAQKPGHRTIAEGWLLLDHGLDWIGKARIDLRGGFGRLVIDGPPRHAELGAKLGHRHRDTIGQKALMERSDQLPSSRSMRAASFFLAHSSSMASP